MKKFTCLMIVLVMCLSLAVPVFATEDMVLAAPAATAPVVSEDSSFVPSITYKPNPEIVPVKDAEGQDQIGVIVDEDGNVRDYVGHGCLLITPIAHVWDPEVEVPADVERLLTFVYEELSTGKMLLPYEKFGEEIADQNMVIRDLFDARWVCDEHREMIEGKGIMFEITFDLGIAADVPIYVMTYDEETKEWDPIVKTVNNGDGTVTCTFEHLCAITFSMPMQVEDPADPPSVFDWGNILFWIILLIVAIIIAIIVLVIILIIKKKKEKEESAS